MKLIIALLLLTVSSFSQNTTYQDGTSCQCDSISRTYHAGEIWYESPYVNGELNGIVKLYSESGALLTEYPWVNGKPHGIAKHYYESGQLWQETPYVNDKQHGIVKYYFESGKLAGKAIYEHGKLIGYKECTDGRKGNESLDCLNTTN